MTVTETFISRLCENIYLLINLLNFMVKLDCQTKCELSCFSKVDLYP